MLAPNFTVITIRSKNLKSLAKALELILIIELLNKFCFENLFTIK